MLVLCPFGRGAGGQWGYEEGVPDVGLLAVLFHETCSMVLFCAGVTALKCLEARDTPVLGSAGYREASALEKKPEPPKGPRPWVR